MQIDGYTAYHARYRPEQPALVFGHTVWTYSQLEDRVGRCAAAFGSLGLRPGDRLAILAENSPWFVVALLAGARAGALAVPLNYRLAEPELHEQLAQAGPRMLVGNARHIERIDGGTAGQLPDTIVLLEDTPEGRRPCIPQLIDRAAPLRAGEASSPDGTVLLQFTSGTTGKPKGVLTTHAAWLQSCLIQAPMKRLFVGTTLLAPLPMCHTGGIKWMLEALLAGSTSVIMGSFDADAALNAVDVHRVSNLGVAPTMLYQMLAAWPTGRYSLKTLRYVNSGGAALDLDRVRQVIDQFDCRFIQGYGMSEVAGGTISILCPEDYEALGRMSPRLASVGRPLPDCEVCIVDESGTPVQSGSPGEIWLRTTRICRGYLGEASDHSPVDANGFYHTGDIGREDEHGYLYIVDRAKDMIVSGGLNIYSREVEDALLKHPAVSEAYVIGEPDTMWGETVHAFIVLRDGEASTSETLVDWCRTLIGGYKQPRRVTFVRSQDLPRTAMGKVQKQVLRTRARQG